MYPFYFSENTMHYLCPVALRDLTPCLLKEQLVDILAAVSCDAAAALHKQYLLERCPQHAERINAAF